MDETSKENLAKSILEESLKFLPRRTTGGK